MFRGHCHTIVYDVPGEFVVSRRFIWETAQRVIVIPRGFITDFASIPKPAQWLYSVNGKTRKAAVLHDYLYCEQRLTRELADAIFMEAMIATGVDKVEREVFYRAVRLGGWKRWNERKKSPLSTDYDFVPEGWFDTDEAF